MDRKSLLILVVCAVMLLGWKLLLDRVIYPPTPLAPGATNAAPSTVTTTNPAPGPGPGPLEATVVSRRPLIGTNQPEQLVQFETKDARYTFSSYGGGLKEIELLRFPETIAKRREQPAGSNEVAALNRSAPTPALALLGGDEVQGDGIFTLTRTVSGVLIEKTLPSGLSITKDFQIQSNYVVAVTVRLDNRSGGTLKLPAQEWSVGTATQLGARDDGQSVGMMWYNGVKSQDMVGSSFFSSNTFACTPRTPPAQYQSGQTNIVWAAVHNQYFALAAMLEQPAQDVIVRKVTLPRLTGQEAQLVAVGAPPPSGYEATLVYPALTLTNAQVVERKVFLYAGPKEYETLAVVGNRFNNNLDQLMSFGMFGFVSKALLLGMNTLYEKLSLSYGWAIIAITVLIKLLFWPLTQASTRSMKRMQALQPQMNAIKEKYKDDPVKMNRKTMEFMKENKVSPLGGCLPMLIQIPVFFGFYTMIRSAIELRGASFLWVADLSKPDTLFIIPNLGFVPVFGIVGVGLPFNPLPLIMGVTMLWQARLAPPSPGMDATQARIMRYMPLIFMLFLYNYAAGLTLYWTVQNLLTVLQTKLTRTTLGAGSSGPAKAPVLTPPQKKKK
jgi:YidC/Oxa1 family membrane protein insertase